MYVDDPAAEKPDRLWTFVVLSKQTSIISHPHPLPATCSYTLYKFTIVSKPHVVCVGGSQAGWRSSHKAKETADMNTSIHIRLHTVNLFSFLLGRVCTSSIRSYGDSWGTPSEICVSMGNSFNLQWVDKQQHCALRSVNTLPSGIGEPIHFIKLY